MKALHVLALTALLVVSSASAVMAEKKVDKASAENSQSDKEQLAADYRARQANGDTSAEHGYQPCRDGGRCGYWGYGWGGGYRKGTDSAGWSRSYWRGSDIPTTGYHYSHSR